MSNVEKTARLKRNLEFCKNMTILKWSENILLDLQNIQCDIDLTTATTFGLGPNYRVTSVHTKYLPLEMTKISKSYRTSYQRLILIDWIGTLEDSVENYEAYEIATSKSTFSPSTIINTKINPIGCCSNYGEIKEMLTRLTRDSRNHIFIISDRDLDSMQYCFGSIEGLGLAAEHGCYYRSPKQNIKDHKKMEWQTMISLDDRSWMDSVKKIMDIYTQRTHGSYIEVKQSSLIWQFRDADHDFGSLQSKELEEHLADILSTHPLEVIRGSGIGDNFLEIRLSGLSKGLFLKHILSQYHSHGIHIDFLLTIGDDKSDEEMFHVTNRLQKQMNMNNIAQHHDHNNDQNKNIMTLQPVHYASITVGQKVSCAQYYVNSTQDIRDLLHSFLRITKLGKEFLSSRDLFTIPHTNIHLNKEHIATVTTGTESPLSQLTATTQRSMNESGENNQNKIEKSHFMTKSYDSFDYEKDIDKKKRAYSTSQVDSNTCFPFDFHSETPSLDILSNHEPDQKLLSTNEISEIIAQQASISDYNDNIQNNLQISEEDTIESDLTSISNSSTWYVFLFYCCYYYYYYYYLFSIIRYYYCSGELVEEIDCGILF